MRIAIWKIEAKILGWLLLEAAVLTLVLTVLVAEVAAFPVYMWRLPLAASLAVFGKIVGLGAAAGFGLAVYHNVFSVGAEAAELPAVEPLAQWPELERMVQELARELGRPAPASAAFSLSPTAWKWMAGGAEAARIRGKITIPAGCLSIWSIMSLRCQIGHALVRRRSNGWLLLAAQNSMVRLSMRGEPGLRIRPIKAGGLLKAYAGLVFQWTVMAEMEADARIAEIVGSSAVAAWLCQTQMACAIVPGCLRRIVEPAAGRGMRVPVHVVCAAHNDFMGPVWSAVMEGERVRAQRSKGGDASKDPAPLCAFNRILLMRLAALPGGVGTVHDPRPAATLVNGLDALEEKLLRREAGLGTGALRRAEVGELGEVLLPAMREEVARNASALEGRSMSDLPELVRDAEGLAAGYRADPCYLFSRQQRKALVPGLLASFLAVELVRHGWQATYCVPPGLILERNGKKLSPHGIIRNLRSGKMTPEAFLELVNGGG